MAEPATRLALLTPHGVEPAQAEPIGRALGIACRAGAVAAVLLRLAPADERGLINLVKSIAPSVQEAGAALIVECSGFSGDLVGVAARGGADGVHADRVGETALRDLRGRLRDGRILGAGGLLESKHEAMAAGEAGADYLMFGGLYPDGAAPDFERVRERAQWWAEIFETPCIAVAAHHDEIGGLARTGAEFLGLESALWLDAPEAVAEVRRQVVRAGEPAREQG